MNEITVYQRLSTPSETQHEQRICHFRVVFLGDVSVGVRGQILLSVDPPSRAGRAGAGVCHFRRITVMTLREVSHEQPPVVNGLAKSSNDDFRLFAHIFDDREELKTHISKWHSCRRITAFALNVFRLTVSEESLKNFFFFFCSYSARAKEITSRTIPIASSFARLILD